MKQTENISTFLDRLRILVVYTLLVIISFGAVAQLIDFENGVEIELSESSEMETNSSDENLEDYMDKFIASLFSQSDSFAQKLSAHDLKALLPEKVLMEIPSPPPEQII